MQKLSIVVARGRNFEAVEYAPSSGWIGYQPLPPQTDRKHPAGGS